MGIYKMCPACKAVNSSCVAENCDEVMEYLRSTPAIKVGAHWIVRGVPELKLKPTLWQRCWRWWRKRAAQKTR